ncbi:MAG: amidase [Pseudomonadota bacterium]|nr:amidase [Pseudomonadota bacterium]
MIRGDEMAFLEATAARAALERGEFSAVEYVSALIDRIGRLDPLIHAFLALSPDLAIGAARCADERRRQGRPLPPLHGLPFAVKDLIDVQNVATTAHSRVAAKIATKTATAVRRLQRQGAIYIGKLALEEFGIGSPLDDAPWPSPGNPWDRRRTAGGSSSGSAVALAAGLVPLTLGTDTGGSVRAPAAYCGGVALKPTAARVSGEGVLPLSPTLDTIGPMARSARDCGLLFAGLTDTGIGSFAGSAIGVVDPRTLDVAIDTDVADAMTMAVSALGSLGCPLALVDFPYFALGRDIGATILQREAYVTHRTRLERAPHLYGETTRRRLSMGAEIDDDDYEGAVRRAEHLGRQVDAMFARCDVIATPITFGAAPLLDDAQAFRRSGDGSFRLIFNVTGHPAIVFCTGFNSDGLPLSMQLVGRRGEDERLLELAAAYQRITGWHEMHPSDPVGGPAA